MKPTVSSPSDPGWRLALPSFTLVACVFLLMYLDTASAIVGIWWRSETFAHGFLVLSQAADFLYKTTAYYAPEHERCVAWNDPDIGIHWPLDDEPALSAKDRIGTPLRLAEAYA